MMLKELTKKIHIFQTEATKVGKTFNDQYERTQRMIRNLSNIWGTERSNAGKEVSNIAFDSQTLSLKKGNKIIGALTALEIKLCQFIFEKGNEYKFKTSEVENKIYSKKKE